MYTVNLRRSLRKSSREVFILTFCLGQIRYRPWFRWWVYVVTKIDEKPGWLLNPSQKRVLAGARPREKETQIQWSTTAVSL